MKFKFSPLIGLVESSNLCRKRENRYLEIPTNSTRIWTLTIKFNPKRKFANLKTPT